MEAFFACFLSRKKVGELADGDGGDGQAQDGPPLRGRQGDGLEDSLERRQTQDRQLHQNTHREGPQHGWIGGEANGQKGAVFAPDIEGVEELAEGQGGKGHGVGGSPGGGPFSQYERPQEVRAQSQKPHHHPLPGKTERKRPVKQGFMGVPGLLPHHARLHRLHTQRQRRERVGHQIEP